MPDMKHCWKSHSAAASPPHSAADSSMGLSLIILLSKAHLLLVFSVQSAAQPSPQWNHPKDLLQFLLPNFCSIWGINCLIDSEPLPLFPQKGAVLFTNTPRSSAVSFPVSLFIILTQKQELLKYCFMLVH